MPCLLKKREKIAKRPSPKKAKTDNAKKSMQIMDVNEIAVKKALKNADILIHGHTHRPYEHLLENGKKRLVLGDWRMDKKAVNAVIAVGYDKGIELLTFTKIK